MYTCVYVYMWIHVYKLVCDDSNSKRSFTLNTVNGVHSYSMCKTHGGVNDIIVRLDASDIITCNRGMYRV